MIYRKVAKVVAAAFIAAFLFVGPSGGVVVFGQQSFGAGCEGCSQTISFPTSNVSSMPQQAYSSPVTQPLPTISNAAVYSTNSSGSYQVLPAATFASGSVAYNGGAISEPAGVLASGTLTSIPAPVYSQPAPVVQPRYYSAPRTTPVRTALSTGYQAIGNSVSNVSAGLAQRKAQQAANGRIRGHIGGGLGGAKYEGVGWSNRSAQAAIEQCCYWGTRPTAQIGVSRGSDGLWYACVLYN